MAIPELKAAVPFYGRQPDPADVPRIEAPLLLHYAGLDTRINEGWPAYEQALKANGKTYEVYIYPGVNHGFHNDSTPATTPRRRSWPGAGPSTGSASTSRKGSSAHPGPVRGQEPRAEPQSPAA
ncbi:Dienelactone hydrolase family [Rubellimicrobium mesophilum DSM 19309]|uniref:Dienelactone hydrolase family n=1 Tax=Rubellimicrobium mesophilum DSM 19309 TaxID=442562 RepID=A0A017HFH2_9RHOB|nr:Dienelactone hydrolase family [Rubellimicrobium mesophilum DSM 19309]